MTARACGFIQVKNFERFQHYKDRTPPWIKLYNDLLDDYEFARLQDASKLHLVLLWLLASRYDNLVPADPVWIGARINATEPVDLDCLLSAGFITMSQDASDVLALARGERARGEGERETEEETETATEAFDKSNDEKPSSSFPQSHRNGSPSAPADHDDPDGLDGLLAGISPAVDPDELPATLDTWMPLLRSLGYEADGRDGSVIKQLFRKGIKPKDLEPAVRGLPLLVKHGRYPVGKGQKLNMRMLYASGKGKMPAWVQATDEYNAAEGKKRPVRLASL